ncbi:hypothetical protein MOQ_003563 [Trypanosoma cruzi marinkellei]|uniref:Transcription factor Iwr1 domain-containing protein n=1 Tax=Trypanosoma cruzi marinkellei TaxID=85056 RepID=K2MBQ0_TRYCR|nr:hypothetical protein MOQ_003563 [Trypanosoma cruzi marinkellei]
MTGCEGNVQQATGSQGRLSPRSRDVYIRMKRLRSHESDSAEDTAPPRLRICLDNRGDANSVVRRALGVVPSPSSALLSKEQNPCTLHFRLLSKVGISASERAEPRDTHKKVVPTPTPLLSVERLWNLTGCLVMDCTAEERKWEPNSLPMREKNDRKINGNALSTRGAEDWLLYILDKEVAADEDEPKEQKEEEGAVDEEFGFDDLVITKPEADGGAVTPAFCLGRYRAHRKRCRDDTTPEYILSLGPHSAEGGGRTDDCEGEISLYDMLRDHGQDLFLLEEDAGCEPELYIYPDHRRDDEYDSNAADFSGNEYPEEKSTSSNASVRTDSEDENDAVRRRKNCYGDLWFDEDYAEASLSSGWSSHDSGF